MYYEIVPMDRSHIEEIAALEKECFSTPWTEQMLTDALFDSQASFIVAEAEDGHILGYAGLHVIVDEGYIDNIAVTPDARRHGGGLRPAGRVLPLRRGEPGLPHSGGAGVQPGGQGAL